MPLWSNLVALRSVLAFPWARAGVRPQRASLAVESLEDRAVPTLFTVVNLADGGDGSLRQAILDANSPAHPGADVIRFANGLSGTIPLTTGQLSITDALTINGPGAALLAVSGSGQSRVFAVGAGTPVAIADLTIADGMAVGDGGGILNTGGTLTLDRVVLSDNHAGPTPGGANGRGGAVANLSGATLTVTDCLFTGNEVRGADFGPTGPQAVASGAGILNLGSSLTVSHSWFIDNQAIGGAGGGRAQGGGINNADGATALVTESAFLGNRAIAGNGGTGLGLGRAGALFNDNAQLTVANSTIVGNLAQGGSNINSRGRIIGMAAAGGIFNSDKGDLILRGSTVSGNRALGGSNNTSSGGTGNIGTAFGGGLTSIATAEITDCVFANNEARAGSGNRGGGAGFQVVGSAIGGGIATLATNTSGSHASTTLDNVTIRHNRAVGGDGNTTGTVVGAGIGGGIGSSGGNNFVTPSGGSEVTLRDSLVAHNQAVGGLGGDGLGGGVANTLGGVVVISGSALTHNQAQGGTGGNGLGGGIYNGPASTHPSNLGAPTVLTVEESIITHNKAEGGAAGDGMGGGLWNGSTASVLDTAISHNHALGSDGGNGLGGGVYNDSTASLTLRNSLVTKNHANGGDAGEEGSAGEGIGGGVCNLGSFDFDARTRIFKNHASTSDDDVFDPFA